MIRPTAAPSAIAQRLWEREGVHHASPEATAAVVERVCADLRTGISRWIGGAGYGVLLERALTEARKSHPVLVGLSCLGDHDEATVSAARAHGRDKVQLGFIALVDAMIERLGRVVGNEMAVRLVEQAWAGLPGRSNDVMSEGVG